MIHILVVEDDEKLNRIVCTYLNDSGFRQRAARAPGKPMMKCIISFMT